MLREDAQAHFCFSIYVYKHNAEQYIKKQKGMIEKNQKINYNNIN